MNQSFTFEYQRLAYDELTPADQQLIDAAMQALDGAHAPYSHFQVGSAVLMADGSIVTGNNQENAAYPSGLCAERVALFAAKSQSKQPIQAITVVARNAQGEMADAFSCGNCRQVMLEYAGQQQEGLRVIMGDRTSHFIVLADTRQLLPFSFGSETLG